MYKTPADVPQTGLAGWLLRHRGVRIALVAISFPVPFTNLLGGALLALTARVLGWRVAATDGGLALLLLGIVLAVNSAADSPWQVPLLAAVAFWGGTVWCAATLTRFRSLTLAIQELVAVSVVVVLVAAMFGPDPVVFWTPVLADLIRQLPLADSAAESAAGPWLASVARVMNGLLAASTLTSIFAAVMLGHWMLGRESGREAALEFSRLRLGRILGLAAVAALLLTLAGAQSIGGSLLVVFGIGFSLQGLAVVHWWARQRKWPAAWPLVMYGPFLLSPALGAVQLLVLATVGLIDNWRSLRPEMGSGMGPGRGDGA